MLNRAYVRRRIGWAGLLVTCVASLMLAFMLDDVAAETDRSAPMLVGLYPPDFVGEPQVLREQVQAVDEWAGQKHSLVGMFIDLEAPNPGYDIPTALNQLHDNGYTGFINLTTRRTAKDIGAGVIDEAIQRLASAYADWAEQTESAIAFLAPLPEMNGAWEIYGLTPDAYKQAYFRIQAIFDQAGVPRSRVRWVFAPNGWSEPEHRFERYYPGAETVDLVAFSAYNWGYCANAVWGEWQSPEAVFGPYLDRMRRMAPGTPIVIAQTATTSMDRSAASPQHKNDWLQAAYRYLAAEGVNGILYFNLDKECDWAVFPTSRPPVEGYVQALQAPGIGYEAPDMLTTLFMDADS